MKKLILLLFVVVISGCSGEFDVDTMVCGAPGRKISYEIRYKNDDIRRFSLIETFNYEDFSDTYFENREKAYNERANRLNKVDGLHMSVTIDGKVIIATIDIDYSEYNIEEDPNYVLDFDMSEEDFSSIQSIREIYINNGFNCDEIVDPNTSNPVTVD